jgi:hypothetical protein
MLHLFRQSTVCTLTDVALLLISFFEELPSSRTFFNGKKDSRKQIFDNLGPDRVSALLNANEIILKALASLGTENLNIDKEYTFWEQFVCFYFF